MRVLITPAEVADAAFGGEQNVRADVVTRATIFSAQRKFIEPVFGGMVAAMEAGDYDEFVEEYIKPPLALYVKYLLLPALSAQVGMEGVVRRGGYGFESADDNSLRRLLRRIKSDADTLIDLAVELVEASPERYPEYSADNNVRHRSRMVGGVIL